MTSISDDAVLLVSQDGKNYKIKKSTLQTAVAPVATALSAGVVMPGPDMEFDSLTGELNVKSIIAATEFLGTVGSDAADKELPTGSEEPGGYYILAEDYTLADDDLWGNIKNTLHVAGSAVIYLGTDEDTGGHLWRVVEDGLSGGSVVSVKAVADSPLEVDNLDPQQPVISLKAAAPSTSEGGGDGVDGYITGDTLYSLTSNADKIEELEEANTESVGRFSAIDDNLVVLNREIEIVQEEIAASLNIEEQGEWLYQSLVVTEDETDGAIADEPDPGHFYIMTEDGTKPEEWNEVTSIILAFTDVNSKEHTFSLWQEGDTMEVIAESTGEYTGVSYGLFRLGAIVDESQPNHFTVTPIRSEGQPQESLERRHFVSIFPANESGGDLTIETADNRYIQQEKLSQDITGNLNVTGVITCTEAAAADIDCINLKYVKDNLAQLNASNTFIGTQTFQSGGRNRLKVDSNGVYLGDSASSAFMASQDHHAASKKYVDKEIDTQINKNVGRVGTSNKSGTIYKNGSLLYWAT